MGLVGICLLETAIRWGCRLPAWAHPSTQEVDGALGIDLASAAHTPPASTEWCMLPAAVAYIKYDKASSAAAAIEGLHETVLNNGRGPMLKVMIAEAPTRHAIIACVIAVTPIQGVCIAKSLRYERSISLG